MVEIYFKYKDKWTNGEWASQRCICESIEDAIDFYGLDKIEYKIISVREIKEDEK